MLDFIVTRCYTKTQIYFFVSVSRRSLPCIQSYFSNRRTSVSAHRTVSPSHWLRGMWHGCKPIGISGLTKQTRDILFYLELLFQNASGAFAAEGFFYKSLPANGGFGKGQQTNLTRRNQKGGNYEIKRCTNCH